MAIGPMKQSNTSTAYLNSYVADTEADVSSLPTNVAPGSSCLVIETGNVYILNTKHQWKLLGSAGTSGGTTPGGNTEGEWENFEDPNFDPNGGHGESWKPMGS